MKELLFLVIKIIMYFTNVVLKDHTLLIMFTLSLMKLLSFLRFLFVILQL